VRPLDGACPLSLTAAGNMRRLRSQRGLGQLTVALDAGISQAALCLIETGQRNLTLPVLAEIARALGTEPHELLRPGDRA
jgi:transcriptional regulator with XRE-family HTH domain